MRHSTKRRLVRHKRRGSTPPLAHASFDGGSLRRAALIQACSIPYLVRTAQAQGVDDAAYRQDKPYRPRRHRSLPGLRAEAAEALAELAADLPQTGPFVDAVLAHLKVLADVRTPLSRVLAEYLDMLDTLSRHVDAFASSHAGGCRVWASGCRVMVELDAPAPDGTEGDGGGQELSDQDFILRVGGVLEAQRRARRRPTREEAVATNLAYVLLARGVGVPIPPRPWASPGFRDVQTYMSVTDPGEGHLLGTTGDARHLHGVIVHVEHLERGLRQSRKVVEAYRIPAPMILPRVRLHVGADAPCSSYVGRPVFEADFASSVLKAVHTVAAACSEIFSHGFSEAKVAIENMSATQAVDYMRALAANVARDPHLQILSAAFCLNDAILDDRPATLATNGGEPLEVRDRFQIGLLGIELTAEAGLDKVTWDGAADTYPSTCVLEQLSPDQAMTLVHRAHEKGLLTYFSGGFRLHHLAAAVHTGADGIGVGGAQILRFMDPTNGHHGPFKADNITEILAVRDEAARSPLGVGAHVLARLDQMYFEKSITPGHDALRRRLFEALTAQGQAGVEELLEDLGLVLALPPESGHPLVASAGRLLAAGATSLAARAHGAEEWRIRAQRLEAHIEAGDHDQLGEELADIRRLTGGV